MLVKFELGMLLEYKNDLWQVLKTQHVKPGKGWGICSS